MLTGAERYHSGLAAERSVAREYLRRGHQFIHHRYRGHSGEIDIIFKDRSQIVFVEVKKSRSIAHAAAALSKRQIQRIQRTAAEFLQSKSLGLDTDCRFDVALVDQTGCVEILENSFIS